MLIHAFISAALFALLVANTRIETGAAGSTRGRVALGAYALLVVGAFALQLRSGWFRTAGLFADIVLAAAAFLYLLLLLRLKSLRSRSHPWLYVAALSLPIIGCSLVAGAAVLAPPLVTRVTVKLHVGTAGSLLLILRDVSLRGIGILFLASYAFIRFGLGHSRMPTDAAERFARRARSWSTLQLSWPSRILVALMAGALVWFGLRGVAVRTDPVLIELRTNRPIEGTLSYRESFPRPGTRSLPITPEQVSFPTDGMQPTTVTVTVTALSERNPRSLGREVSVSGMGSVDQTMTAAGWTTTRLPSLWTATGQSLMNATGGAVPLEVPVRATGYVDVTFQGGPWGGMARVSAAGQTQTVDLYRDPSVPVTVRLLLPVPIDVSQRVSAPIPATARDLTLTLTGGRRSVRLEAVESSGVPAWSWDATTGAGLSLGPGVRRTKEDTGAIIVSFEGEKGSMSYSDFRPQHYRTLQWRDALFALVAALLTLGALSGLADNARSSRERWSAVASLLFTTFIYARAAPLHVVGRGAWGLGLSYEALIEVGSPLVHIFNGVTYPAAQGDDPGLYATVPYVARWLSLDVVYAAVILVSLAVVVGGLLGLLGALRLCRSATARLWAGVAYATLGWVTLNMTGMLYAVQFPALAAFVPWLFIAFTRDREPPRWSGALLLSLGILGSALNLVRFGAVVSAFVAATILILWAHTSRIRKARLLSMMAIGMIVVSVAIGAEYAKTDAVIGTSDSTARVGKGGNTLWHQVYIGLGYTENPYVSDYRDEVGFARFRTVDPEGYSAASWARWPPSTWERYNSVMKNQVWQIVRSHPVFVARQAIVKLWEMLRYFVLLGGVFPWFNIGLLGLASRRVGTRTLAVFGLMLVFQGTIGLLVVPYLDYMLGFATAAALLGIVAADAGLGERPVVKMQAWVDSTFRLPALAAGQGERDTE